MTEKHKKRRQDIIEAAFRVWGEDSFRSTSLASLAGEMGISKTALYRYFSGKDELIAAMEAHFITLYEELSKKTVAARRDESLEAALDAFLDIFVRFFAEQFHYLRFAQIQFLKKPEVGDMFLSVAFSRNQELFPASLLSGRFGSRLPQIEVISRYIFAVTSFLLVVKGCGDTPGHPLKRESREKLNVEQVLLQCRSLILHGFAGGREKNGNRAPGKERVRRLPPFEKIEGACRIGKEDFPETDRIIRAVSEVVAQNGLWKATVEAIAGRLGMSKSSLYFYFENRDQMLWEMIDRERHNLGRLVLERLKEIGTFEEKLYAYFVLFLRYVWGRPEFLAMMNWFRFQEFNVQPPEDPTGSVKGYYRFLQEGIDGGIIDPERSPVEMVLRFMHFLLMQEITTAYRHGNDTGQLYPVLRSLHQLFLYGIEGA